ncbi:MAG: acyl-ACP--UDP-N-acetylglucosamine O-acyltransferase [Pseudomonadota bacterium]
MSIHPTAIIEAGAVLADDVEVGPYCCVGAGAVLETGVRLLSHVTVSGRTLIGAGTVVHPFAVLGSPPQHLGYKGEDTALEIGPRNIIREHSTMNIGTSAGRGVTRVGADGFFMVGAHVGHDCQVGDKVVFANNATLGGHVVVGDGVFLGGLCAVHQNGRVGAYAFVGGCAAVTTDVIPYASAVGNRARLTGLNVIGLKRRGVERGTIHALRAAYRELFFGDGHFKDRVGSVAKTYADVAPVMKIVDFINEDASRSLMSPVR